MELTDFLTEAFIKTFSGTLISVELIVFVTKELPIIKKIRTKVYTFILALAHLLIVKVSLGTITWNIGSIYILLLNATVVAVILCGGYDSIITKIQGFNGNSKKNLNLSEPIKNSDENTDYEEKSQNSEQEKQDN